MSFQEGDGKTYRDADRWDGSKWADAGLDVKAQSFSGREEIGFPAAGAGLNGSFDFTVLSVKMVADAIESADRAPDSIVPWTYELTTRAAEQLGQDDAGQVRLAPARVAGKPVTVRVAVQQGDTKQQVASAVTTCSARVRGDRSAVGAPPSTAWRRVGCSSRAGTSGSTARARSPSARARRPSRRRFGSASPDPPSGWSIGHPLVVHPREAR